jgi:hypothetical protein
VEFGISGDEPVGFAVDVLVSLSKNDMVSNSDS